MKPHNIADDLKYEQCVKFEPRSGGSIEVISKYLNVFSYVLIERKKILVPSRKDYLSIAIIH